MCKFLNLVKADKSSWQITWKFQTSPSKLNGFKCGGGRNNGGGGKAPSTGGGAGAVAVSTPEESERERKRGARKKERRATLILGLIMGSFIACWFPFFFLYSIRWVPLILGRGGVRKQVVRESQSIFHGIEVK